MEYEEIPCTCNGDPPQVFLRRPDDGGVPPQAKDLSLDPAQRGDRFYGY